MRIVNLSSIHQPPSIPKGLGAFTALCDEYSTGWMSFSNSLFHYTNMAWVAAKYQLAISSLINPYKLGNLTAREFIGGFQGMMYFLKDMILKDDDRNKQNIQANLSNYFLLTGKDVSDLTDQDYIFALLEDAWNALIEFQPSDHTKISKLTESLADDPIIFVSNTNELNVHKILCYLYSNFSDINWYDLTAQPLSEEGILTLAPNIYLLTSYHAHTFKTDPVNQQALNDTPSLFTQLFGFLTREVEDVAGVEAAEEEEVVDGEKPNGKRSVADFEPCSPHGNNFDNIQVISQYPGDLTAVQELELGELNIECLAAKDYYPQLASVAAPA